MTTRLYFHAAGSGVAGTLPTTEQSTLTAAANVDAQTVNRSMDTNIGVVAAPANSLVLTSIANTSANNYYFTKFVSPPIFQSSIAANTWTYAFAATEQNANANFPVSGTNAPVYVNCYVWRPSTGAKIGTILDGNTAATVDEAAGGAKTFHIVTFSGLAVPSVANGDVIILEIWFRVTQALSIAYTNTFFYDGTSVDAENAASTTPASYLETPETLNFTGGNAFTRNIATETVTISSSVARVFTGFNHFNRSLPTETVSISSSVATVANTTGRFTSSQTYPRPVRPRIKIYNLTDSSYSNALYTYDGFSDSGNTGAKPISLSFESTTGNAGTFSLEIEDSTSSLDPDTFSRGNRVVIECSKDGSGWRTAFKGVIRSIDQRVYGQTGKNIILKGYSYLIRLTERVVDFQAQSSLDGSGNYIRTDSSMFTNTLLNTILTNDSTYLYSSDDTALYNLFRVNNIASSSINQWIPRIDAQLATLNDAVGSILEFSNSLLGMNMSNDQLVLYNQEDVTTDSQIFLITNKMDQNSDSADTTMYPIEPYTYSFGYDYPDNANRLIASIGTSGCPAVDIPAHSTMPSWFFTSFGASWSFATYDAQAMEFIPNAEIMSSLAIGVTNVGNVSTGTNRLLGKIYTASASTFVEGTLGCTVTVHKPGTQVGSSFYLYKDGVPDTPFPNVTTNTWALAMDPNVTGSTVIPGNKYFLVVYDADNISTSGSQYVAWCRSQDLYIASIQWPGGVFACNTTPPGGILGWYNYVTDNGITHLLSSNGGSTWPNNVLYAIQTSYSFEIHIDTARMDIAFIVPAIHTDACGGPPNTADADPNFLIAADMNQINRIGMVEKVISSLPDHIKNAQTMNEYLFNKIYTSSKPKFTFDFPSLTMPNLMPKAGDIVVHVDGLARVGLKSSPVQTGIISQINYDFKQDDQGVLGLTKLALSTTGIKRGSY